MNTAKVAFGGLLAFVFAAACGGMSGHSGGSNTNWFESCTSSAECQGGLECLCGMCTKGCTTECSSSAAGATCGLPPSCTDTNKRPLCAVECTKDADCSGLGSGASCAAGVCRKGARGEPDSGTPLTCNERSTEIVTRVQRLANAADVACQTAADCVDFPGIRCEGGCGTGLASRSGVAAVTSQLSNLEQELCAPFEAAGCQVLIPPCVFPGNPACIAGECRRALPGETMDSGAESCDALASQIGVRMTVALDAADKVCTKDADCTRVGPATNCNPGCSSVAVSNAGAVLVAAQRDAVERELCPDFGAHGCVVLPSGCPFIPGTPPACIAGHCQNVYPPPGEDAGLWCADRTAQFQAELQVAVDAADRACTSSSDCTSVQLANGCYESCTYAPVSSTGAKAINDALSSIEQTWCPDFTGAGCPIQRLPCPGPAGATCQGGKCVLP